MTITRELLMEFCDKERGTDEPKVMDDGSVVATNGAVFIQLTPEASATIIAPKVRFDRQVVYRSLLLNMSRPDATDRSYKLADFNPVMTDEECDSCGGTGTVKKCSRCDGEGECTCDCGHEHTCGSCDWTGYDGGADKDDPCEGCNGGRVQTWEPVRFPSGHMVNGKYIDLFKRLPGATEIRFNEATDQPGIVRFSGGWVIFMTMQE